MHFFFTFVGLNWDSFAQCASVLHLDVAALVWLLLLLLGVITRAAKSAFLFPHK
jgi:hypothetical protein